MKSQAIKKIPNTAGIYFFKKGKEILYIGKATSLRDRVKSYFNKDLLTTRGPLLMKMMDEATNVSFIKTDSVLEALILEANQIKKYQPIYNTQEKDNKSFNYVTFTKEDFPQIIVTRGSGTYGPFPHSRELKEALRIIRRIFPFRDNKCKLSGKPCFNAQIGLCPGVCAGRITKAEYKKTIRHLKLFFEGKKTQLVKSLEKDMKNLAKVHKFEEAEKIKKTIFALNHILDVSLLKQEASTQNREAVYRIEAYDIAHISGTNTVGVMTVIEDGEVNKNQYRKFKIREVLRGLTSEIDDTKHLKEVIRRRLGHLEWDLPNLIVVDGGTAQINAARSILIERGFNVEIVAVVKDERHKVREVIGLNKIQQGESLLKSILLANSEAHRFAIAYHRNIRGKRFKI